MGVKGLTKVIRSHAPLAITERPFAHYSGRKVAIDASTWIYQFLIAVRFSNKHDASSEAESTSHLQGFLYRTIRLIEGGIWPVFVFDGLAPALKRGELDKRRQKRDEAARLLAENASRQTADNDGRIVDGPSMTDVEILTQEKRTTRVSAKQQSDLKHLLQAMGVPVLDAPGEAEATCAALARLGLVDAVVSEDMDTLCFGAPVLLRGLSSSATKKTPVQEIRLARVLTDFEMSMQQFIDLSILLGCDYCDSIAGIGPKKAFDAIKEHKTIERFVATLGDKSRVCVPSSFPVAQVRDLFHKPIVLNDVNEHDLQQKPVQSDAIVQFMCSNHGFPEDRMRRAAEKLTKAVASNGKRIDQFFKRTKQQNDCNDTKICKKRKLDSE